MDKRKMRTPPKITNLNVVTEKTNNVVPNQIHYDLTSRTLPGVKLPNKFGFFQEIVKE